MKSKILTSTIAMFIIVLFACITLNLLVSLLFKLNTKTVFIAKYIFAIYYIFVPYIIFALLSKTRYIELSTKALILVGLIATILERLIWMSIAYFIYKGSIDNVVMNRSFFDYMKHEIIPFFNGIYVFVGGFISLVAFVWIYRSGSKFASLIKPPGNMNKL